MDETFRQVKEIFDKRFRLELQMEVQGFKYHYEGDVYTHTMMVVKEAYEYDKYESEKDRNIHILASFCHDLGKPDVGRIDNDRIIHQGHSGVSIFKCIDFLFDVKDIMNLTLEDIMRVLYIVNNHDAHFEMNNFSDAFSYYKKLYEDLKTFSVFDLNGRIMKDKSYGKFPQLNEPDISELDNCDNSKEVILLIGVPNSGKDTYLNSNNISKDIIVSRDDILMEYGKSRYGDLSYNQIWKTLTKEEQNTINNLMWKKFTSLLKDESVNKIYINLTNTSFSSRCENEIYTIMFS